MGAKKKVWYVTKKDEDLGKRFRRMANKVLFKSRMAMPTQLGEQHYNQWYEIATIPDDLLQHPGIVGLVARAFIANKYERLNEDQIRAEALALELTVNG